MMLPIIAVGAVYLHHRKVPDALRPGVLSTLGLWIAAALTCLLMVYYAGLSL